MVESPNIGHQAVVASTAASGYIAGTLSSTWTGAFILGNSSLLGSLGLVSAAGIFSATGGLATLSPSAALGIGPTLTAVGLGGAAKALGIAPAATFLGLTPIGWSVSVTVAILAATLGYYFTRKTMHRVNEEREKGDLGPITLVAIVWEVQHLEARSLVTILARLDAELDSVSLSTDRNEVIVDGQSFPIHRLKYVVNRDGSGKIVSVTRTGIKKRDLLVKAAPGKDSHPA